MMLKHLMPRLLCLLLAGPGALFADAAPNPEPAPAPVPDTPQSWETRQTFGELGKPADRLLLGIRNIEQVEFQLRHDRIATEALLKLDYTPSPALIPVQSHLRIYLNDELMGTLPITREQLGQRVRHDLALDARLLSDFNRVRLEFVGHYADVCEDPAHSSLWLNVSRKSLLVLREQALGTTNDLAFFPLPFFDKRDTSRLVLPMVLGRDPSPEQQRAAGILASYFGAQAGWRGSHFPVSFDSLPPASVQGRPAIVFARNDQRPDFLQDLPPVDGPVIELIDRPGDPYAKLLLVLGRDDADLVRAATALAVGDSLFRGNRVAVRDVQTLQPREPYDAPNWMRTDRPVRFQELLDYPQQLQVSGLQPRAIEVNIDLPPDLFVWRNQGIPLRTRYRYTPPPVTDESRLNISINDRFIDSIPLTGSDQQDGALKKMRLEVTSSDSTVIAEKVLVPALMIGDKNTLRFDFNFASKLGNAQEGSCQTYIPTSIQAAIDEDSTIDMSGYHHYMALPDMRAFVRSGFPFSRMADLSETLVVVPERSSTEQVGLLLDTLALIASHVGYPAIGVRLTADWQQAAGADADLLLLAPLPDTLREAKDLHLLLDHPRDWLQQGGNKQAAVPTRLMRPTSDTDTRADTRVEISALAPIGALVGLQSPFDPQRSIVAFLASQDEDYRLLREALGDEDKLRDIAGSVSLVRSSGINSHFVGEHYYVGSLPWWLLLWFHLSGYPVLMAVLAALCVVMFAFLLWHWLRLAAKRRLAQGA